MRENRRSTITCSQNLAHPAAPGTTIKLVVTVLVNLLLSGCIGDASEENGGSQEKVEHFVGEGVSPGSVPGQVSSVSWNKILSDEERVLGVHPVPIGIVLVYEDGLVALSGESGEEVWRYREEQSRPSIHFSYNGEIVALEFVVKSDSGDSVRVLMLDGSSGEILEDIDLNESSDDNAQWIPGFMFSQFNEEVRIATPEGWGGHELMSAKSIPTGDEIWAQSEPLACSSSRDLEIYLGHPEVISEFVVRPLTCAEKVNANGVIPGVDGLMFAGIVAFDLETGEEAWRFEEEYEGTANTTRQRDELVFSSDGNYIFQNIDSDETNVLKIDSGERVPWISGEVLGVNMSSETATVFRDGYYRLIEEGGEVAKTSPPEACPGGVSFGDRRLASLESGVLLHCEEDSSGREVFMHQLPWRDEHDGVAEIDLNVNYPGHFESVYEVLAAPGAVVVVVRDDQGNPSGLLGLS